MVPSFVCDMGRIRGGRYALISAPFIPVADFSLGPLLGGVFSGELA